MKHSQFKKLMKMTESELTAYAEQHKVDMPLEFGSSDRRRTMAEYICNALGLEDPDKSEGDGSELDRLAREYQSEHPDVSYSTALGVVGKRHPQLTERAFPDRSKV